MTDTYCVFGNPIAQSQSPRIHTEFARQTGQDLRYERRLAPVDGFAAAVREFIAQGGRGANVTVPFKEEALRLSTRLTPRGSRAGAVNTLLFSDGEILGDNTDGVGLLRDILVNLGFPVAGRRVLLLGAGGAARGAVGPLLDEKPAALILANRNGDRAQALVAAFADAGPIAARAFADLAGERFDLVIDATSSGLAGATPPVPKDIFAPESLAYAMVYGPGARPFLEFSGKHGAGRVSDGLGMLVEQAAEAFFLWRGVRPATQALRALLNTP